MPKDSQDAQGRDILDYFQGKGGYEVIERDDGYVSISPGPQRYFLEYDQWPESEKQAIAYAQGRVLDIGCGAGRHALYLQKQGYDVTGIDSSPRAIQVSKARGLRHAINLSLTGISSRLGRFDTILMLGNNFALVQDVKRARWLLKKFHRITSKSGIIIAQTISPYQTRLPEHLEYYRKNRESDKMPGQLRIRVRYKKYASPWMDYLLVSKNELKRILSGTNWRIKEFLDDAETGSYVAIMGKRDSAG